MTRSEHSTKRRATCACGALVVIAEGDGFFRYKSMIGETLKARNSNAQTREAKIGCHVLNRMAELGRPQSYAVVS